MWQRLKFIPWNQTTLSRILVVCMTFSWGNASHFFLKKKIRHFICTSNASKNITLVVQAKILPIWFFQVLARKSLLWLRLSCGVFFCNLATFDCQIHIGKFEYTMRIKNVFLQEMTGQAPSTKESPSKEKTKRKIGELPRIEKPRSPKQWRWISPPPSPSRRPLPTHCPSMLAGGSRGGIGGGEA